MAQAIEEWTKDPDSVLDYVLNWSDWLATGETISSSSWTVAAGITKDSDSNTTTTATVWLSGGTDDADYDLVCQIVTSDSRTVDRTIRIRCRER